MCSKLIAIKLCAISEMHAKVRRESVAGYATDETLVCGPKEHTRWWQRYRGHLQGILYRLILNSYITATYSTPAYIIMCDGHAIALSAGNGMAWPTPLAPNGDANRTATAARPKQRTVAASTPANRKTQQLPTSRKGHTPTHRKSTNTPPGRPDSHTSFTPPSQPWPRPMLPRTTKTAIKGIIKHVCHT